MIINAVVHLCSPQRGDLLNQDSLIFRSISEQKHSIKIL